MRFVFVMDPVSTVIVDEDTSFGLMLAAQRKGHRVDHCLVSEVGLVDGRATAQVRRATLDRSSRTPVSLGPSEPIDLAEVDAIFIRKDPPFDDAYLWLTLVLEAVRGQTLVINDPRGLRDANEKLYACHFPSVMPRTLVSASKQAIREFTESCGGTAIIKPIDGHGGAGIFKLGVTDGNFNAAVETVTREGRRIAMVQEFIPEVTLGDKRILLLDGDPLGAIMRVPQGGDVRSNIHVGGRVEHAELDEADRRIVEAMAPKLREDGLFFVGLDVIGQKLTEVNVTSPTGIQQISRLGGTDAEARVIEWTESKAALSK